MLIFFFFFATLRIYKRCVSWSIQTAITEKHKLGGLNNRLLFPTVPETEKSKIKVLADFASGENLLPGSTMAIFFIISSHGRKGERGLWGLVSIRARISFMWAPPT